MGQLILSLFRLVACGETLQAWLNEPKMDANTSTRLVTTKRQVSHRNAGREDKTHCFCPLFRAATFPLQQKRKLKISPAGSSFH